MCDDGTAIPASVDCNRDVRIVREAVWCAIAVDTEIGVVGNSIGSLVLASRWSGTPDDALKFTGQPIIPKSV
jgi:hypothetical protein